MEKNHQDRKNDKSGSFGSGRDSLNRDEKIIPDPRGARKNLEEDDEGPVKPMRSSEEGDPNEMTTGYSSEGEE